MEIKVYGKNNCKYCTMLKLFLQANGANFNYYNIDEEPEAYAEWEKLGVLGAPVSVVDGNVVNGFVREQWVEVLGLE